MANGFALRGFTTGFTTGLQNVNQLINSATEREMLQRRADREDESADRQNRYYEALIKNQERDNNRLDAEAQQRAATSELAQRENRMKMERSEREAEFGTLRVALAKAAKAKEMGADVQFSPAEEGLLSKHFGYLASADVDRYNRIADGLESGAIRPDSPEALQVLLPIINPAVQRNIGAKGFAPDEIHQNQVNQAEIPRPRDPVTIATKEPIGFKQVGDKWVPMLRVQGAGLGGKFISYEAPYTKNASSDPEDPMVGWSPKDMASKARSAANIGRLLQGNPKLLAQVQSGVDAETTTPISPEAQAKIQHYRTQDQSLRNQDVIRAAEAEANVRLKEEQRLKAEFERASGPERERLRNELTIAQTEAQRASASLRKAREAFTGAQTGNVIYGRPGLASGGKSSGKSFAAKVDPKKIEMWFLNDLYNKDIGAANDPEVMKQLPVLKNQITNMMQLGEGQVSQDFAQTILYDAIKKDLQPMKKQYQGKTYRGYAYNGKFYPFAAE